MIFNIFMNALKFMIHDNYLNKGKRTNEGNADYHYQCFLEARYLCLSSTAS